MDAFILKKLPPSRSITMARRSKTGKRPAGKRVGKKTYNKVKSMMAKQTKAKAKKSMDTKFVQCVTNFTLVPQQGATVANYIYNNFQLLADPTQALAVTGTEEFKIHQAMYDKVRINSIRIVVTPKANTMDATRAQADTNYTLIGDGLVHSAIDRDGTLPWASSGTSMISAWQQYSSYKPFSQLKKFSRSYSVRYPTGIWLDAQNLFEDTTLLKRLGLTGCIGLYSQNFVEDRNEILNEPYASVAVYYNCVFQGQKAMLQSVDASGNVIFTPVESTVDDKQYETWHLPHQDISGNEPQ